MKSLPLFSVPVLPEVLEGLLRVRVADAGYASFYLDFCDFPRHFPALAALRPIQPKRATGQMVLGGHGRFPRRCLNAR